MFPPVRFLIGKECDTSTPAPNNMSYLIVVPGSKANSNKQI